MWVHVCGVAPGSSLISKSPMINVGNTTNETREYGHMTHVESEDILASEFYNF